MQISKKQGTLIQSSSDSTHAAEERKISKPLSKGIAEIKDEFEGQQITSDQEFRSEAVRRYFLYLEHQINKGTHWSIFEPKKEKVVRKTED